MSEPWTLASHLLAAAGCSVGTLGNVTGLCTAKSSISIAINYPALVPLLFLLWRRAGGPVSWRPMLPKRRYPGLWAGLTVLASLGTIDRRSRAVVRPATPSSSRRLHDGRSAYYDQFAAFFAISVRFCHGARGDRLRRLPDPGKPGRPRTLRPHDGVLRPGRCSWPRRRGLISLFLGLEILSISLYTMSAYHRRRAASGEAGLKYFILGSFASAIFIYGVALIYGATGSTQYVEIIIFLASNTVMHNGVLLAGMGLLIVGLGFKVAAVPFHFWSPDVYQGAPTPFVGYMAAVAKAGGFAGLVRVLMLALPTQTSNWRPIIWVMATASVLVGGVLALVQVGPEADAGLFVGKPGGLRPDRAAGRHRERRQGVCFYLFTYAFMVIGTFAVVGSCRAEARPATTSAPSGGCRRAARG